MLFDRARRAIDARRDPLIERNRHRAQLLLKTL
jgi:hypothetical protein